MGLQYNLFPQTDGQSERTIQTLEGMPQIRTMDFGSQWDIHLQLFEIVLNNGYYTSIEMTPYEALYGKKYRSPLY